MSGRGNRGGWVGGLGRSGVAHAVVVVQHDSVKRYSVERCSGYNGYL